MEKDPTTVFVGLLDDVPLDFAESIGRLTICFGRLEHMVLISLKRIRQLTLKQANDEYGRHSLGKMISGSQACEGAGEACQNYDIPPSLRYLAKEKPDLQNVCAEIEKLIAKRNNFMHGLVGFVIEKDTRSDKLFLIRRGKILELKQSEIHDLEQRVFDVIEQLNQLVPIPGLALEIVSAGEIHTIYESSAIRSIDPLAEEVKTAD